MYIYIYIKWHDMYAAQEVSYTVYEHKLYRMNHLTSSIYHLSYSMSYNIPQATYIKHHFGQEMSREI